MKPEDLLRAMSEIDDDLIERSDKKHHFPRKPLVSLAACLVLILSVGFLFARSSETMQVALFYSVSADGGQSYEQAAEEALSAYYSDHRLEYTYYNMEASVSRDEQIDTAVAEGCQLLLLDGRQEQKTLLSSAVRHPQATFLALGISTEELTQDPLPDNVICIDYRPEIAGYLAGYTAVKEGYTKLGYYYDSGTVSYFAYGSGYLQGIEAAAKEMGITDQIQVRVSSTYLTPEKTWCLTGDSSRLIEWYNAGTQMVLACGAVSCQAAASAAEYCKGDAILIGKAQSLEESAQHLKDSIAQILDRVLNNRFDENSAGEMPYYTLNDPDGTWGFRNVKEADFILLRNSLINGSRPCQAYKLDPGQYEIAILIP